MKRKILIALLALISILSGISMSHSRWIAKVGITFLHKGYNFTKVWWQGAIAIFLLFIILLSIHSFVQKRMAPKLATSIHFSLLMVAIAGFYLTVQDFKHDLSHHMLGYRFHTGVYGFWVGWVLIALYFLSGSMSLIKPGKKNSTAL